METAAQKTVNRAATVQKPAASIKTVQRQAVSAGSVHLQSSTKVSSPHDPAEKEADTTAKKIMRMAVPESSIGYVKTDSGGVFRQVKQEEKDKKIQPKLRSLQVSPYITRFADTGIFTKQAKEEDKIQRQGEGQPNVSSNVAADIQNSMTAGSPLPLTVRRFMEPRFGANFNKVKIHTGDKSAKLNKQLNAQAFAMGNHIFFGKDKFQPDSQEGKELIAHELTHTIQQGEVAQRREDVSVTQQSPIQVQRLGLSDALNYFADKANLIPGFRMFTIVLGVNPINMSSVDRSAANILRAIVEFIPGGGLITQALDNYGVFEKVGKWVESQIKSLGLVGSAIKQAVTQFLDSLSWTDIFDLGGVWNRAKSIFTDPIDRIISFAKGLLNGIIEFIKDAILRPLAKLAEGTKGYDLLKAVLGKDPVTGDPVPQTADTLIGGFMKLIGQEEVWNNLKKANGVARAWAWFQGAMASVMGFVGQIPTLFLNAFKSLELVDIVLVPRAFAKVVAVFGKFMGDFMSWAGNAVWNLLEIIFDVVSPGAFGYIKKTGAALKSILKNPLPFISNLVKAAKLGFQNFADRIGGHLKAALIDWLTGSLPGVYIPKAFSLSEIVKFVFSVLGLTWQNIRQKLVKVVGETAVKAMETGFDIVVTLVTQGPAAAWDKIKEQLANLKDMVIGGITDLVVDMVTKKAIPKIVAMFIPGAGFISAILSIYDTVMVFVNKISKIIQVVTGFINSITAIASGAIGVAASRVETTLAGLLSLAINFLAGFAGLGKVSDKVMGVISTKARSPIDKAIDWLINWIVTMAKKLFAKAFGKKDSAEAFAAVGAVVDQAKAQGANPEELNARLAPLKTQYQFKKLTVVIKGDESEIDAEINPVKIWKYAGQIKMIIIYDPSWPLDEFMSKAKAIQRAATAGRLMTLPLDPITSKQQTTKAERGGEQDALRDKVRTFILTKVTEKKEQARLLAGLSLLQADHQLELQMMGEDKPGNLALIEGAMNKALGWNDFRPALKELPPATKISEVRIDISAVEKQKQKKKRVRRTGTANQLKAELLKYAKGGEIVSVRSWFKLEE
ncbi:MULTISPECIES: eCIS core domain-containing protein [Nostoc]|uniref:DUF4157 domain-containing protein n=2 Tax=Nostoc TaxID=1177 RepID=A0ABR8IIV3_9NOSO|nr:MULTISPECIES: DUF4157 domain-containing protein [Nostoc]MBD2563982.1 DUF4157 domain-containing protein [Nostoc linckia FACHB-391]MBD2650430.1 DUF4157 domain-containing protein [Nostoc foliaceum FACHB-393]